MSGPGPMMVFSQIESALRVVDGAINQMNSVSQRLQAQAGLSEVAMKAPAGTITANNFVEHGSSGKALAETLNKLRLDLDRARAEMTRGTEETTSLANRVGTISSTMNPGV